MEPPHPGSEVPATAPWWGSRRFGLLVHATAAAVPAWAPIGQYAEWYQAHLGGVADTLLHPSPMVETIAHHRDRWGHVERYAELADLLHFDEFDAAEWSGLARAAGMGYLVMVAKHHDGMCWWDAPGSAFTSVQRGPRRNVLADVAEACQRDSIVFGTAYSLLDWHDPDYPDRRYVDEVVHPHVRDLVERYGTRMLWADGHWGKGGGHWRSDELIGSLRSLDPELVVNDRWWADTPGVRSYDWRLPPGVETHPWETRRPIGLSFGFNRNERPEHLLSAGDVVALLTEAIAKGGHLLLGVGAEQSGRISELHAAPLRRAGVWIAQHADLLARAVPWTGVAQATWGDARTRYLVHDGALHAVDLTGAGTLAALGRAAGRVRSVVSVTTGTSMWVEQDDTRLQLAHPGRGATGRTEQRRHRDHPELDRIEVYRIEFEPAPPAPIELFEHRPPVPFSLADALAGARPGDVVQLGEGTYLGPGSVPDGVVVRGFGPGRTTIEVPAGPAVTLGAGSRLEHCAVRSHHRRIAWLPNPLVVLAGARASVLGCSLAGHVEVSADDGRVTSCTLVGVTSRNVSGRGHDRLVVSRSALSGINWDRAIDIEGGSGHLVDGCEFADVLEAVHLNGTTGASVRGNVVCARWWGVLAVDTEATTISANSFAGITRAVDLDGGTQLSVTGNVVRDGDSGCVVQRGATEVEVAGNRWERTRIGLLAWDAGTVRHHANTAVDLLEPGAAVTLGP